VFSIPPASNSFLCSISNPTSCGLIPILTTQLQIISDIRRAKHEQIRQCITNTLIHLQICNRQIKYTSFFIGALLTGGFGEVIGGPLLTLCLIRKLLDGGHVCLGSHAQVWFFGGATQLLSVVKICLLPHSNTYTLAKGTAASIACYLRRYSRSEFCVSPCLVPANEDFRGK